MVLGCYDLVTLNFEHTALDKTFPEALVRRALDGTLSRRPIEP